MTHRTARQIAAERRKDPVRHRLNTAAVLAPSVTVAAVVCADCQHPRLIHRATGPCLRVGCDCPSYREQT